MRHLARTAARHGWLGLCLFTTACASASGMTTLEDEVARLRSTVAKMQQDVQAARVDAAKAQEAARLAQTDAQRAGEQSATAAKAANAAAERADRIYQNYLERR